MIPKYINANELKAILLDRHNSALKLGGLDDQLIAGAISGVIRLIDTFPAAEVAEIVRCKDCKYRPTDGLPYQSCPMWDSGDDLLGAWWKGDNDGFCHYGERRKDDAEIH